MNDTESSNPTRRGFIATGVAAVLAGCSSGQRGTGSTPTGNRTGTPTPEPSTVDAFVNALESAGITVDSTMSLGGGVSVMYMRDSDAHAEQVRTVARTFVSHRTIVGSGSLLSFTALSSNTERHGEGYINRTWADSRATGDLSESDYFKQTRETYRTL